MDIVQSHYDFTLMVTNVTLTITEIDRQNNKHSCTIYDNCILDGQMRITFTSCGWSAHAYTVHINHACVLL